MKRKFLDQLRKVFQNSALEKRLRKAVIGKDSQSILGKLVPNNYQYPLGSYRKFEKDGVIFELDIHDYVSHYLYFGFKDKGHLQLMQLVKPDFVVLDIGTNYGTTILQFASLVGKEGYCFGFEPDKINYSICQNQLQLNNFKNVEVANIGLGAAEDELFMVVESESNRGRNKVSDKPNQNSEKIKIRKVDDWVSEKQIKQIDLIKIDVEGFEMNVLQGSLETMKQFKPICFVELDDENLRQQGSSAREVIDYFIQLNYNVANAETGTKVTSDDNFDNCHFDVVAKPTIK